MAPPEYDPVTHKHDDPKVEARIRELQTRFLSWNHATLARFAAEAYLAWDAARRDAEVMAAMMDLIAVVAESREDKSTGPVH